MTEPDPRALKAELRRHFRAQRRSLEGARRAEMDAAIRASLADHPAIPASNRIAAFWPFDGEPDLIPLLGDLERAGVSVCLPVLESDSGPRRLVLHEWCAERGLETNWFGIREPVGGAVCPLASVDIVLVPLVAWDRRGHRLGMVAGYYDRLFAGHRNRNSPQRVGVAYTVQEAEALPVESWDIPLHAVVTERGWFTCPT